MMLICIKQHLSIIWGSIHEKLSNTDIELKKRKLKLSGSYLLNISSLHSSATAEINVFIVHTKHEDLSLQKIKFQPNLVAQRLK